ncbi:NADPH-dependent 2,4-dienoyl-CoA reductase/sulfur reductase-like enzyme [Lipingzhangella halophila]|uniref:NADPH-dependent 2,4-dienoyl-CoA reductase/sulfur reductase-like enzyme n=1 Tax=Lipingzhangella halophila TaxID=1783352 RepID=A0A7W7RJB6_9ACTN|nr:FAD-dependent oxidoreductase [Lipingzhangella halophila]MBB4933025.1 NADPH-dependent 2,4-dienoyl-CoA reductase/sulfur reductase-like enzyme [Lipingzhangella halophila]
MRKVTVVGASLAGLNAARSLRTQGFDGALTIVGAEHHPPYDRPPLSKEFLLGKATPAELALHEDDIDADLDADWRLGTPATGLDTRRRVVHLADGTELASDGVVVATGAAPRALPGAEGLSGVHVLRTLDDAEALRADLNTGTPRIAVVGGSFIGAEIAASCAALGLEVTVVEASAAPLAPVLGQEMAAHCAALHRENGVRLLCGARVARLLGQGKVTGVELDDGRHVPADVVVAGIGVRPNTAWLTGSGVDLGDGVLCDTGCRTSVPGVVAVGDVARLCRSGGGSARIEHWSSANLQPAVAVRNLLAGATVEEYQRKPYFWSDQYGVRLQFAGTTGPGDTVRVVEGDPDERSFAAVYEHGDTVTAVLAMNRPRPFTRLRRSLA